jgi:diacylglycerol kinase (ATP)
MIRSAPRMRGIRLQAETRARDFGIFPLMRKKGKKRARSRKGPAPRCLLIVNPRSGGGKYRQNLSFVEQCFRKRGIPLEIKFTERAGHATVLAREAGASGYGIVIGAGGDGTINEVLNGLAGTETKLAILPWGTGNVFAREMEFPKSLRSQCAVIANGRSLRLDTGTCGDRHFLLMCGAGFDAYSLKHIEGRGLKRALGMLAYVIGGIRAFARYRYPEIEAELPDGRRFACSFALVSNTSRYGAFFSVSPKALPNDGLLDLFLYRPGGPLGMIRLALALLRSSFSPGVAVKPALKRAAWHRAGSVRLSSKEMVYTQLDGDVSLPLPVDISVAPASISCILPAKAIRRLRGAARKNEKRIATGEMPKGVPEAGSRDPFS